MNEIEQKLNKLSREIEQSYILTKSERVSMFRHVVQHVHDPEKIPSPYHRVSFPNVIFMNAKSFALLAVFLCTGVLSYAAEKSLPGDTLYAVKTQFNENVQSFLTFSPTSKAKLEASLAEKRLVEAQKLAVESRLSSVNNDQLQQSFQKHSDEFKKTVQTISASKPDTAVSLSSDFQSTLAAHENVLKTLSTTTSSVTINVGKEIISVDDVRKQAEESLTSLSEEEIQILAHQKWNLVLSVVDGLSKTASSTSVASTTEASLSLDIHIVNAESILNKGVQAFEGGKYFDAYVYFQTALREAKEAELTLENTANLNLDDSNKQRTLGSFTDIGTSTATTSISIATTTSTTTNPVQ